MGFVNWGLPPWKRTTEQSDALLFAVKFVVPVVEFQEMAGLLQQTCPEQLHCPFG